MISINATRHHAGIWLSAMLHGQLVHRLYIGYPLREARQRFRVYLKNFNRE